MDTPPNQDLEAMIVELRATPEQASKLRLIVDEATNEAWDEAFRLATLSGMGRGSCW